MTPAGRPALTDLEAPRDLRRVTAPAPREPVVDRFLAVWSTPIATVRPRRRSASPRADRRPAVMRRC